MRKHTATRITSSSTTKLRLHTEVIRELQAVELRGAPVGGCLTGSHNSVETPYELGRGDNMNVNSTCPMM